MRISASKSIPWRAAHIRQVASTQEDESTSVPSMSNKMAAHRIVCRRPFASSTTTSMTTQHPEVIESRRVPRIGPYSQAVRVGNLIFTAGQPGIDPATGQVAGPTFEAQARQALA